MKKILFTLTISLIAISAKAEINLYENLSLRNELFIATQKVRPYLQDEDVLKRLDTWITHDENEEYVVSCQYLLNPVFHQDKILAPLCYFLRQDDLKTRARYFDFVNLFILQQKSIVFEIKKDPRYKGDLQKKAQEYFDLFDGIDEKKLKECFNIAMREGLYSKGISFLPFSQIKTCLIDNFKDPYASLLTYIGLNPQKDFGNHNGEPISPTGWIPGNRVTYLTEIELNDDITKYLDERFELIPTLYPLNGRGSYESMIREDLSNIFTVEEGFDSVETHPVWSQTAPSIFREMLDSMEKANDSIFIDIFFLGGTMGASLAKHLVGLLEDEKKPNLKAFILRDLDNHFGHREEMMPVYNYLLAYSNLRPDKLLISKSHIDSHISGLPVFLKELVTTDFLIKTGLQKQMDLNGRAISDHSKVMVIDGKSNNPVAFVGSKNWTDSSGAICYDEVVKIEGPAAAVVLDDFYFDMFYALDREFQFMDHFLKNGWARFEKNEKINRKQKVALILQPFDLLNRDENLESQLTHNAKVLVSTPGSTILRTGYNNVDSSHNNSLAQVLQMISAAERNIYIKDQYLFDRNVVLALLKAKERRPSLDIKILLEPLHRAPIPGLPNILYADLLTNAGIEIRFKNIESGEHAVQEYHMKTISADGKFVISGSANKDQTTMYGSFREEQVDVFDEEITKVHDEVFARHWKDAEAFTGFNFNVPFDMKGLDGKELTEEEFISLIRSLISIFFDAKMY